MFSVDSCLTFHFMFFLWLSKPTFLEDNSPTIMLVGLLSSFCQQVTAQSERKEYKERCEPFLWESHPSRGSWFDCTEPMATFTHRYSAIHVRPQEVSFSFTKLCRKNKSRQLSWFGWIPWTSIALSSNLSLLGGWMYSLNLPQYFQFTRVIGHGQKLHDSGLFTAVLKINIEYHDAFRQKDIMSNRKCPLLLTTWIGQSWCGSDNGKSGRSGWISRWCG